MKVSKGIEIIEGIVVVIVYLVVPSELRRVINLTI